MSTRSFIAMQIANGAYYSIYCHSDGYPSFVGRLLETHWRDEVRLRALLELGDLSQLGEDIGEQHDFEWMSKMRHDGLYYKISQDPRYNCCKFYGRDRGEGHRMLQVSDSEHDLIAAAYDSDADYLYVWRDGEWTALHLNHDNPTWGRLCDGEIIPLDDMDSAKRTRVTLAAIAAAMAANDD